MKEHMLAEVALNCSSNIADRVSMLVEKGVCLQAVSTNPLKIPMSGHELISLKA